VGAAGIPAVCLAQTILIFKKGSNQ